MTRAYSSLTPRPDPAAGLRLRALRLTAGLEEAEFVEVLGLDEHRFRACERGEAPLPAAVLPALARLVDAPLAVVLAERTAPARRRPSRPNPSQREALLHMALALSDAAEG